MYINIFIFILFYEINVLVIIILKVNILKFREVKEFNQQFQSQKWFFDLRLGNLVIGFVFINIVLLRRLIFNLFQILYIVNLKLSRKKREKSNNEKKIKILVSLIKDFLKNILFINVCYFNKVYFYLKKISIEVFRYLFGNVR